jgi:hypothetical protein
MAVFYRDMDNVVRLLSYEKLIIIIIILFYFKFFCLILLLKNNYTINCGWFNIQIVYTWY